MADWQNPSALDQSQAVQDAFAGLNVALRGEAWHAPTLLNAWVNYSAAVPSGYYKDALGIVRLRGLIKSGTMTAGTSLFTLPTGYIPAQDTFLTSQCDTAIIRIDVIAGVSSATVKLGTAAATNGYLQLDGLLWRAAA